MLRGGLAGRFAWDLEDETSLQVLGKLGEQTLEVEITDQKTNGYSLALSPSQKTRRLREKTWSLDKKLHILLKSHELI